MKSFRFVLFISLSLTLFFACNKNPDLPLPGDATFAEVIASGGEFETFTEKADSTVTDSSETEQNGEKWLCVTKKYDFVTGGEDYFNFNPSSEIIWPGNLLQGNSITEPTPNPIVVDRGAGCVTIDLVNGSTGTQQCMDKVSQGNIIEALNEIIDDNNGILPAQFSYTSEEVHSQQQMAFKMGVNYKSLTTDVKAKLSINSSSQYNSFLVTLTQNFYTMIFEKPTSYDQFFGPDVTPDDLKPYISADNPGTYVSSVTYGRRFYLLVESTASRTKIKASIKASYDAAVTGGSLAAGAKYVKDLENSNIKVFALGGDQGLALSTFNGDMDAVGKYLTEGGDYRTGVPLSYVVRSLETHQDLAIKVATEYETTVCEPVIFDDNPPSFTSFWGDAFDAIGAATLTPTDNQVILFNKEGDKYVVTDQINQTFTGPYSLDDESAPLRVCPFDRVGAAQLLPSGNIYLHDGNGTQYVAFYTSRTYSSTVSLSKWGNDDHPFDLYGISAAIEDRNNRVIHFDKQQPRYVYYTTVSPYTMGSPYQLYQWGPDNTIPMEKVGAAVQLRLAQTYYVLFNEEGTGYAIYSHEEGKFIGYYEL